MMEKGIGAFIREFNAENDFIMQEATKRVSNSLVRIAPVDEGEYLADWDVDFNKEPPPDLGAGVQRVGDPGRAKTRQRLQQTIKLITFGDTAYFVNDDPVAVKLEYGYSKQAPQGVVRLTARRWRSFVRGAAKAAMNRVRKRLAD